MTEQALIRIKAERLSVPRLQEEITRLERGRATAQASPEPQLRRQAARFERRIAVYREELEGRREM